MLGLLMKITPTPHAPPSAPPRHGTLVALWRWLLEPSASLPEMYRRRARLLSGLLLTLLLLNLLAVPALILTTRPLGLLHAASFPVALSTFLLLSLVYGLNRAGYHTVAARLTVSIVALGAWAAVLANRHDLDILPLTLMFVVISPPLSSLLLSVRATTLLSAGHVAGLLLLAASIPGLAASASFIIVALFVVFASGLTVVAAILRRRDLAQMERQTRTLAESEARQRLLFAASPDAILLMDPAAPHIAWPIVDCNEVACHMNGYTREELIGQSIDLLNVTPGNPDEHMAYLERIRREGVLRVENLRRHQDGHLFPVEVSTSLIAFGGRELVLGIDRDITERKRIEVALREAEAKYRTLVEQMPAITYIDAVDETSSALYFSPHIETLLGYPVNEWLADPGLWPEVLHPDDRERVLAEHNRTNTTGEPFEIEYRMLTRQGKVVWVRDRAVLVRDSTGQPQYWQGVLLDITERKQIEETLQEAEAKYRALVEQLPAITYVVNLQNTPRTTYISPQVESLLGFSPAEWLADPDLWTKQLHPDDRARVLGEVKLRDARGEPLNLEYRVLTREGRTLWFHNQSILVLGEGGRPRYSHGIMFDITERKLTEEALQAANEKLIRGLTELEQRTREITLLNQLGDLLQTCLNVEEAYTVIGQSARQLFPDETGALYMISASRNIVEAVVTWGQSPGGTIERVFAPEDCWALRRGALHLVEDTRTGLRCRHLADPPPAAALCIPMIAQSEAAGVLCLQSNSAPTDAASCLTPAKQRLAQTVADSIALALANLRLRETLRQQSIRDPLTGLFNRRYMEETLEREVRRVARVQGPLGIIMLDIDHFKQFNDTFGHDAGDALLSELGAFLRTHVRGEDVACRYGGEEFTLILPEASLEVTQERAEHLCEDIRHLHAQYSDQPLGVVTLSLGVAIFPDHGSTGGDVLRAADVALYRAKRAGRDRVTVAG